MSFLARLAITGFAAAAMCASAFAQDPEVPAAASHLEPAQGAKLRALDKITGNSVDISAKVGQTLTHGRIKVTVRACYQSSPQDAPEAAAFLEIHAMAPKEHEGAKPAAATVQMNRGPQPIGPDGLLFSGWMFASSPGLNALEHPTYDVWVISCTTSNPQ